MNYLSDPLDAYQPTIWLEYLSCSMSQVISAIPAQLFVTQYDYYCQQFFTQMWSVLSPYNVSLKPLLSNIPV